jgi:hypothetical protein
MSTHRLSSVPHPWDCDSVNQTYCCVDATKIGNVDPSDLGFSVGAGYIEKLGLDGVA